MTPNNLSKTFQEPSSVVASGVAGAPGACYRDFMIFFAQKAFIVSHGCLLVVQKSKEDPFNPLKWEVPGGRMEEGESIDAHIKREVKEEVGIDIEAGAPFYLWQWQLGTPDKPKSIVAVARYCLPLTHEISDSGRVADDHLGQAQWIALDQLRGIDWIPNDKPAVERFLQEYYREVVR